MNLKYLLIIASLIIISLSLYFFNKPPKRKILKEVMICKNCHMIAKVIYKENTDLLCPKCKKGKLCSAYKCQRCDKIFPKPIIIPPENLTPQAQEGYIANKTRCPNCGSSEIFQIPVTNWEKNEIDLTKE